MADQWPTFPRQTSGLGFRYLFGWVRSLSTEIALTMVDGHARSSHLHFDRVILVALPLFLGGLYRTVDNPCPFCYTLPMMKRASYKAPGKANRNGVTIVQLVEMFPNETTATKWFESEFWPKERCCGHCGSTKTREASHKTMPYWCTDCRKYFSVRTGTVLAHSKAPLRKWVIAIYLELTSLKGISSMKLHRDIGVTQSTAWFMLHRIREAWGRTDNGNRDFSGPVEVDETYVGGKRRNMSTAKRKQLSGRGTVGKVAVAGVKDRKSNQVSAKVVRNTQSETMCRFIMEHTKPGSQNLH